jgi:ATP-dependent Zn protease
MSNVPMTDQVVAYHEAGHAVAMHMTGRHARLVTIEPDPAAGTLGHCEHIGLDHYFPEMTDTDTLAACPEDVARLEDDVVTWFAGHAAERAYTGRSNYRGARGDRRAARELAGFVTVNAKERSAFLRWLWIRTEALVDTPQWRAAIQAVAETLLAQRTLDGEQLAAIIRVAIIREVTARTGMAWPGGAQSRAQGPNIVY